MNKLSAITALALVSISFASAQENEVSSSPVQIKAPTTIKPVIKNEGREIKMPNLKTGDPAIDSQLKALNDEMEAKIKAIRDEYVVKIKAIMGDKMPTPPQPKIMPGKREGMDEGRKLGIPFNDEDDIRSNASGTLPRAMMRIQGDDQDGDGDDDFRKRERGEENESAPIAPRIMNFFRGFFGGNR